MMLPLVETPSPSQPVPSMNRSPVKPLSISVGSKSAGPRGWASMISMNWRSTRSRTLKSVSPGKIPSPSRSICSSCSRGSVRSIRKAALPVRRSASTSEIEPAKANGAFSIVVAPATLSTCRKCRLALPAICPPSRSTSPEPSITSNSESAAERLPASANTCSSLAMLIRNASRNGSNTTSWVSVASTKSIASNSNASSRASSGLSPAAMKASIRSLVTPTQNSKPARSGRAALSGSRSRLFLYISRTIPSTEKLPYKSSNSGLDAKKAERSLNASGSSLIAATQKSSPGSSGIRPRNT